MQQELIEMLDKVVDHVVFCNGYDQRFSSTSYGVKILEEAGELVEKAKNGAKEPAVPQGFTFEQLADACAEAGVSDSKFEAIVLSLKDTPAAPSQPMTDEEKQSLVYEKLSACLQCGATSQEPVTLTESERVRCLIKAGCIGTVKMTYDSGPYEITRTSINADRLIEAIIAALREKQGGV